MMSDRQIVSLEQARAVGNQMGCDWTQLDIEQFRRGLEMELEKCKLTSDLKIPTSVLVILGCFVQTRLLVGQRMHEMRVNYQH